MKNQLLSIVFIDVQGYTRRTATQSREDNEKFISEIRDFVTQHLEKYEGRLVKTMGDGFMVSFESPSNAVQCGLDMQRKLESRNANVLNPDHFVRFRIGVNTGEVGIDEHGDLFGDAVNIAARIESFAEPNEVFISEATYLAMNRNEFGTEDLGPQNFKNATREIRVYKISKTGVLTGQTGKNKPAGTTPSAPGTGFFKKTWVRGLGLLLAFLLGLSITSKIIKKIKNTKRQKNETAAMTPSPSGRSTRPQMPPPGPPGDEPKPNEFQPPPDGEPFDPNEFPPPPDGDQFNPDNPSPGQNPPDPRRRRLHPKIQEKLDLIGSLKKQNKFKEAIQEAEGLIRHVEKNGQKIPTPAYLELGALHLQVGNTQKADEQFAKALQSVANNPRATQKVKEQIAFIHEKTSPRPPPDR